MTSEARAAYKPIGYVNLPYEHNKKCRVVGYVFKDEWPSVQEIKELWQAAGPRWLDIETLPQDFLGELLIAFEYPSGGRAVSHTYRPFSFIKTHKKVGDKILGFQYLPQPPSRQGDI